MKITGFDTFIANYPVYEYRLIQTSNIRFEPKVRAICRQECERYGTTWACPPGVGALEKCKERCLSYPEGVFFTTAAVVNDTMNMEEMLATRMEHERITDEIGSFLKNQGYEIFTLSTESCAICQHCTYPDAPCQHPDKMHPCLESYGVVVPEIAKEQQMEYQLGQNAILWFSLILIKSVPV